MENQKQLTPLEGLLEAVDQLTRISVPISLTDQIAHPIIKAANLIYQCIPFLMEKTPEQATEENVIDLGEIAQNEEAPEETEN